MPCITCAGPDKATDKSCCAVTELIMDAVLLAVVPSAVGLLTVATACSGALPSGSGVIAGTAKLSVFVCTALPARVGRMGSDSKPLATL